MRSIEFFWPGSSRGDSSLYVVAFWIVNSISTVGQQSQTCYSFYFCEVVVAAKNSFHQFIINLFRREGIWIQHNKFCHIPSTKNRARIAARPSLIIPTFRLLTCHMVNGNSKYICEYKSALSKQHVKGSPSSLVSFFSPQNGKINGSYVCVNLKSTTVFLLTVNKFLN